MTPLLSDPDLGNCSAVAWQSLLAQLSCEISGKANFKPFCGLRLSKWTGHEIVFKQPNDAWVQVYEQIQERLARQNRKKWGALQQGVFYTPEPIAHYLVQQTLGVFLHQHYQAIEAAIVADQVETAQSVVCSVQSVRLIDPACGTGVFLVAALECLSDFYQRLRQQFSTIDIQGNAHFAIINQLYGIDIDPLSVAITEYRLLQRAAQLDGNSPVEEPLTESKNFRVADTLNEDPFSGFLWSFVVGNPPFVSEVRKQAGRFQALQRSNFYQAKMDLCDAFTAWAAQRLQPNGQLAYVLPIYWMQRASSKPLRTLLWETGQFQQLWQFGNSPIFKNAPGHHPALLIWQKSMTNTVTNLESAEENPQPPNIQALQMGQADSAAELSTSRLTPALIVRDVRSEKFLVGEKQAMNLLHRLSALPPLIPEKAIQQGVVLPQGRLKKSDWQRQTPSFQGEFSPDTGIFLLTDSEVTALDFNDSERALLKPYFGPTGFLPFQGFQKAKAPYQLIYTDAEARKKIAKHPERYPNLCAHFDRFAPVLTSAFKPYGLHRPRQSHWFENICKILCPRQVPRPAFAVVEQPAYVTEGFYVLQPQNSEQAHFWTALLNSQLGWFWFYHQKCKGQRLQIDKDVLRVFPQPPSVTREQVQALAKISQSLAQPVSASDRQMLLHRLNEQVFQLYQCTPDEVACVTAAYGTMGFD